MCVKKKIMQFNIKVHKLDIIAVFIFVVSIASTTHFFVFYCHNLGMGGGCSLLFWGKRQGTCWAGYWFIAETISTPLSIHASCWTDWVHAGIENPQAPQRKSLTNQEVSSPWWRERKKERKNESEALRIKKLFATKDTFLNRLCLVSTLNRASNFSLAHHQSPFGLHRTQCQWT